MYRLPVFRHRTYEAGTLEEACQLAQTDPDWLGSKVDHECAGEIFISGVWLGPDAAYTAPFWQRRGEEAVAKAEAILAGRPDPIPRQNLVGPKE
jgi:hypothetical protein